MSNQIPITALITFYEYKNCIFAFHRIISYFFNEHWAEPKFTSNDKNLSMFFEDAKILFKNMKAKRKEKLNEINNNMIKQYNQNSSDSYMGSFNSENKNRLDNNYNISNNIMHNINNVN